MTSVHHDPDAVTDKESFVQFVGALIEDRVSAESLERENPDKYRWGGAGGWQNGEISSYLACALAGADAQNDWAKTAQPSWRDLALFLYLGKIYE